MFSRFLDTNFDGSGTKNANGNYSSVEAFGVLPKSGETLVIHRIIVCIEDTFGAVADEYGNLGAALTNGIYIYKVKDSIVVNDLTDGIPIKTNAEWGRVSYDVDLKSWGTTPSNDMVLVRWTFANSGRPIYLHSGESLEIRLNDNLTGLITHTFCVQGYSTGM